MSANNVKHDEIENIPSYKVEDVELSNIQSADSATILTFGLLAAMLLVPESAQALESVPHFLQGKVASLIHPFTNILLFLTSLYSAKLGLEWREIRSIGTKLKELQEELPMLSSGKAKVPFAAAIASLTSEAAGLVETDAPAAVTLKKDIATLKAALGLEATISELTDKRKGLIASKPKDKHEITGAVLLGAGVTVSVLGAFNTYMRVGKLFPGPHLYAGMAITILWAVAGAMVPQMQKGNDTARIAHIACNFLNLALFAWQVPTGLEIMFKVIEKAPW